MEKKEPTAIGLGIGLFSVGLIFVILNIYLIEVENLFFPKLLLAGFVIVGMGLGMLLFPGPKINSLGFDQNAEKNMPDYSGDLVRVKGNFGVLWRSTRFVDKIMWIAFTILGLIAAFVFFDYYNLSLLPNV